MKKIEQFSIIGISVRTDNNGSSIVDIPALWSKFFTDNIIGQIPNKIDNTIYCVYTEYESDYTKPYTTLLGCRVENLSSVPAGLVGKSFNGGNYNSYTAKGNIVNGSAVIKQWLDIWSMDLPRAYTADFEVYGEKACNPENAEVEIFIALK